MKKFLSVLLALAVAFTFTFGSTMSAFAANTTNEFNANVNQAEAQVISELDTVYANVVKSLADDTNVTIEEGVVISLDKAALEIAAKDYYDSVITAIKAQSNTIKNNTAYTDYTVAALQALYADATKSYTAFVANYVDYSVNELGIDKAARAQFAVDKADAIAVVKAIDLSKFSTTEQKIIVANTATTTSYNALASDAVKAVVKKIEAVTVSDTDKAAAVVADLATIGKVANTKTSAVAPGSGFLAVVENIYDKTEENVIGYQFTAAYRANTPVANDVKAVLKTAAEEALAGTQLEAQKTAAIANVTSKAATFQSSIAALTEEADRTAATAVKDAFVEAWTYNINACKTTDELSTLVGSDYSHIIAPTTGNYAEQKYAANKEALAALNTYAAKYAKEYDVNGNLVRDVAKIDKVLKAAEAAMYAAGGNTWDGNLLAPITELDGNVLNPYTLIHDYCLVDDAVDAFALNNTIATLEATYQGYVDDATYYALELEKVKALYDAKIAEYKAAATMTEFNAIKPVDLRGIDTASDVRTKIAALSNYSTQVAKILAYQRVLNANLDSTKDGYRNFANVTAKVGNDTVAMDDAAYWTNFYAENGARTATEIEALYAKAVAAMEAVPTTKELKDQKASVEALIAALPATITLADKPAIKAAWEAMTAYAEAKGANDVANAGTLLLDIKSVEALEEKDIVKDVTDLNLTVNTVKIADKAAVAAVVAKYDAYKADWDDDNENPGMYYGNAVYEYGNDLLADAYTEGSLLNKIKSLEKEEVGKLVAAIPVNVELADKATVEAARAAYDAYVDEYSYTYDATKTPRSYNAASELTAALASIQAAEDAIVIAQAKEDAINKYDDVSAKADLLDMSRKLTIWRTSKTSIRVTAVGSVKNIKANGYTVKYSFYKKNPGATSYKLIKTTTSNKYTYTNLKKGTNKFQVKVKVYDADGKLVATKMTYYRAAKVK